MPNQMHVVFSPLPEPNGPFLAMSTIMHSLKGITSREANKALSRRGAFWQHESYDHVVRNDAELRRVIAYVLDNPVAAGLVKRREDREWSYCKNL
jgi:REP element-mobilizing transposase RayT